MIVCTGLVASEIRSHVLPGDARLQHMVEGSRQALNVRVLAYLLDKLGDSIGWDAAAHELETLVARQPALVRYERQRLSDAEIAGFVRSGLRDDPTVSRTQLLRRFRDLGNACEQTRFASLFAREKAHA
jgi:hypothetical protein